MCPTSRKYPRGAAPKPSRIVRGEAVRDIVYLDDCLTPEAERRALWDVPEPPEPVYSEGGMLLYRAHRTSRDGLSRRMRVAMQLYPGTPIERVPAAMAARGRPYYSEILEWFARTETRITWDGVVKHAYHHPYIIEDLVRDRIVPPASELPAMACADRRSYQWALADALAQSIRYDGGEGRW